MYGFRTLPADKSRGNFANDNAAFIGTLEVNGLKKLQALNATPYQGQHVCAHFRSIGCFYSCIC